MTIKQIFCVDIGHARMAVTSEKKLLGIYRRAVCGEIEVIEIFGFSVFERVADISILFGISWIGNEHFCQDSYINN